MKAMYADNTDSRSANGTLPPGHERKDAVLHVLDKIRFVLVQEGDLDVIAPAFKRCLLDMVFEAKGLLK